MNQPNKQNGCSAILFTNVAPRSDHEMQLTVAKHLM
jgi:hypothetical protein